MRRLLSVSILLLFAAFTCFSQNEKTLKQIKKNFLKQKEFAIDVDLSTTSFSGLSCEDFIEYVAGKNDISPSFVNAAINKYKTSFFQTVKGYRFVEDKANTVPYKIHIRVESLNEQAGIVAKAFISYKDSVDFAYIDLSVKDGRWNSFDVLLNENAEKQRIYLLKTLRSNIIGSVDVYIKPSDFRKIVYMK